MLPNDVIVGELVADNQPKPTRMVFAAFWRQ
jgi:hypothetical protein